MTASASAPEPTAQPTAERTEARLERRLLSRLGRLNRAWGLIGPGERVLVACSGGKDSWAMLHLLLAYRERVPFAFELVATNLDQGHPGYDAGIVERHFASLGVPYVMEVENTHDVVVANTPAGKTYCSRCSRMRRAVLHRVADRVDATAIALGHHREDAIETVLLNMMYAGRLRSMPARLPPQDGAAVIRPLLACAEEDLAAYAAAKAVPILPCDLCGSQPDTRRQRVKAMLTSLEADNPGLRTSLFASLGNIEPAHLLDPSLALEGPQNDDGLPAAGPGSASSLASSSPASSLPVLGAGANCRPCDDA